jgi:hypothetical protein
MKKPKTDKRGNCVACGRLIVPNEDDITKAQLVLYNAGYTCVNVGGQVVYISTNTGSNLQDTLDLLKLAEEQVADALRYDPA